MHKKSDNQMNENLGEILQGREARAERQAELLQQFPAHTLACFTMNIAGPCKRAHHVDKAFEEGIAQLKCRLKLNHINIEYFEKACPKSGNEAYFIMRESAHKVKKIACDLEQYHELGRLFDIDVFGENGQKISRSACNLQPRQCLVCSNPAAQCARLREHGINAIILETNRMLRNYFCKAFAETIAEIATKSLLNEVCVTPKPGLVDCANSGAHSDMDIFSFMNSAAALTGYFRKITLFGANFRGEACDILPQIKPLGIEAENKMYCATSGVNCHMGAIYSLGILCAASGYVYAKAEQVRALPNPKPCDAPNAQLATELGEEKKICLEAERQAEVAIECKAEDKAEIGVQIGTEICVEEITRVAAQIAQNEGDFGARAEAKSGFESVKKWALPMLQKCLEKEYSWNDSCVFAQVSLIANIKDRNVIARGGEKKGEIMRIKAQKTLENMQKTGKNEAIFCMKKLDDEYIAKNLSPGGAADLLAITIFLHYIAKEHEGGKEHNIAKEQA